MRVRLSKVISMMLAGFSLLSLPIFADAGDLTVTNNTNHLIVIRFHSLTPNYFVSAHSYKVIPEKTFRQICRSKPTDCRADFLKFADASNLAQVTFDQEAGIVSVAPHHALLSTIDHDTFHISFNNAPHLHH